MLIECLVEREGDVSVTVQRSMYVFKANEHASKVCDMNSGSHIDYLLKLSDFRLYKEPEVAQEPEKFACDKCGVEFANAAGLSGHKRSKGYLDESCADKNGNKGTA